MLFTLVVTVLNAAGWIGYYIFSGGINESTETPEVRAYTILGFIVCSVIAGLVSFHCTHVFDSCLLNAGHNILTTAMATAPLMLVIAPKAAFIDPNSIGLKQIIISIVLYFVAYFFYFSTCILPTYAMGGGPGWRGLGWLFGRFVCNATLLGIASNYPTTSIGQSCLGYGLVLSVPMSIILAIRNRITD